ncbi:hypothetical protein HMPREF7545_0146 [Selenomonas noxia ATCC 43541]|nr:hypothetical protein HMPREF7545_0146 [Selenomonas noxia ATCC 43541]
MESVDRRRRFRPHEVKRETHNKGCVENFPSKHGKMCQGRLPKCICDFLGRFLCADFYGG